MGKIIIEKELGAVPSESEIQVVDILVENKIPKKHVLFLKPNRYKGSKTPDIKIDHDLCWEIKTPRKVGKYTLDHAERDGLHQSVNLIFDLRLLKNIGAKAKVRLEKDFSMTKKWKKLIIISKDKKVLTYSK